ncbi:hypothetical protein [Nocardia rhizosphaerae]|uniref:Uncharacterized protein n=1 Tax=Nocardia rhizosphaerae TaxID=1691571 RepID=A0ABV8LD38_9NOCA
MALLGLAFIAAMAAGCLRFIINCDPTYLPIGRTLLIAAAISGITSTLAVVAAVIIP